ncbi:MAG: hypothetical protein PWQ09_138 [Candidatus Cloacimonadota bacterium]|nr:hypothetical protein [Candidatus Cloacimonadota bacterium]
MSYRYDFSCPMPKPFCNLKISEKKDAQEHAKLENLSLGKFNSILLSKTVSHKTSCGESKCFPAASWLGKSKAILAETIEKILGLSLLGNQLILSTFSLYSGLF